MMARGFVEGGAIARSVSEVVREPVPRVGDGYEVVRLVAIGSPRAVEDTIRVLQLRGFAQLYEWSPLQPTQNPGEVMSLMRRRVWF